MRSSIATVCISGSLPEKLSAISRAGFDGFELFELDYVTSRFSPQELAQRSADLGLSIDLYQPFRDFEGVSDEQLIRNLRRAAIKFDLMNDLGVNTMLLCSNAGSTVSTDDSLATDQLGRLAELAEARGIRVAYEALAWGRNVSTYDHAWRLVQAVDSRALGMCLDSFHILSRKTPLDTIAEIPGAKIFFCQLADAPAMELDVLSWSRHYRLFPGEGVWNLADFVARLLRAGYSGPLSLEIFNDVFRQGDPSVTARDARRSLLVLEDEISREPNIAASLVELPPVQVPTDFSFIELRPGEGDGIRDALEQLGFLNRGRHRRKNAELWVCGDVRIVVNLAREGREASIVALGLDVADASISARRAAALQSTVVPRDQLNGEERIHAVLAPDGIEFYFSQTGGAWEAEFGPKGLEVDGGVGIQRVDHIALAQPFQRADEAALFFRSMFGLAIDQGIDLASERGLVRSRSLVSRNRRVRLALNVAPSSTTPTNHVAFASDDLLATARILRDRDVRVLDIGDNYYDDLAARVDLPESVIEQMRYLNVLFDRDDRGDFFHLYTLPIGNVYFEVVQRTVGYDGYGASNAPVRLAALRAARAD